LIRGVSIVSGDLGFEEHTCAICGKEFKVEDKICLTVKAIGKGKSGKTIKTVPICKKCFLEDD